MAISNRSSEEFLGSKKYLSGMEELEKHEEEEEEEEELFEINLEVVNNFPPPQYYWESYVTATTNTLLANCLLPIADVSCAIPMVSKSGDHDALPWSGSRRVGLLAEPVKKKNHSGFSYSGAFGLVHEKM